jgi:PAS domain S-box-containing protein
MSNELESLREQLREAQETLQAIRSGDVDALMVDGIHGERMFTLSGADEAYRVLVEEMSEGALTLTAEGTILYANRRFSQMLKSPLEKVLSTNIYTWFSKEHQSILLELLQKNKEARRHKELALIASDRSVIPVYLSVSNPHINKMPDTICLVITDLTEQKQNEEIIASEKMASELLKASNESKKELLGILEEERKAKVDLAHANRDLSALSEDLVETQKRYETAEKIGKVGSWEYDVSTQDFWGSAEAKRIYGFPAESANFTTEIVEDCIPEKKRVHQALEDLLEKGTEYKLEFEIHPFDGTPPKIISSIAETKYDENNEPMKVLGFIQDITQRKQAEKSLKDKKKELETIIEEAPNPIMVHNEDGKVILVNKVWKELTGYRYSEINTIEKWTTKAYGEEMPTIKKYIDNLYELKHAVNEGEYPITASNGETIIWQFSSAPLGIINGKRTVVSSAMDITELKKKDEMIINQSRQAAMGDMIAMIAHQWRQPLTVIGMVANNIKLDIALEEEITTQELEKIADTISEQTQQLSQTIDDFRNFFKPKQEKAKTTVGNVLEGTLKIIGKSLENNNIAIMIENHSETEFLTYPNQLLQVFLNLLGNAKDILLDKVVADAKITIKIDETQDSIVTTICDNGGGIPEDAIKRLGEPYFTTKEKNGTGLGLYMSVTIVKKHLNGSLTWENKDEGACFIVTLSKE